MMIGMTSPTPLRDVGGYWTTSWYDANGRRRFKRFGKLGDVSSGEAQRKYALWLTKWHECEHIRTPGTSRLTVEQLCQRFELWTGTYYRRADGTPSGEAANIHDALQALRETVGSLAADDMRPSDLIAARAWMITQNQARTTINARVGRIRRAFKWAVENELVDHATYGALLAVAPLKAGRTAAPESQKVVAVPQAAIDAALAKMPAAVADMVRVQLLCGCRPTEACMMRACEIERKGKVWIYRPAQHKGRHRMAERLIYLGPKAQAIVRPRVSNDVAAYLFSPLENGRHERYGRTVKPYYDRRAYYQAVARACKAAGVETWSPNQLRHTRGTQIRERYGLEVARAILGHESISTTEIYAEQDMAAAMRVIGRVG